MIDNNTILPHLTYFSRGVELITRAHERITSLPTENWCFPIDTNFGDPIHDMYYAEVWLDGMDYNYIYWIIERHSLGKPTVQPLFFFEDTQDRQRIPDSEFKNLCNAMMHYRRSIKWLEEEDPKGFYCDSIWPFLKPVDPLIQMDSPNYMVKYAFEHASQPRAEFYINVSLIEL